MHGDCTNEENLILEEQEKDAKEKTNYNKCLTRDTKLSSFLGGNPSMNFQFFCLV